MATPRPMTRLGNLFRFGSGRSSAPSDGVNVSADLRPSTSRAGSSGRGVELRTMTPNLEDKVQRLPNEMQESFHRLLGEMYEQETVTMIRFIEDARQSLALSLNELNDEQEVLSLTSNKIAENRLNSASDHRPKSSARTRIGAQTARHRKTPAPPIPTVTPSAGPVKVSRSKTTLSTQPLTLQSLSLRPYTSARRSAILASSLDKVTYETERGSVTERVKSGYKQHQEAVDVHPRPRTAYAVPYLSEGELQKEYEEESHEIMKSISGAESRLETERQRQAALIKDRKELQKVKQHQTEEKAKAIVREITAVEEKQLKDKQRQEQMVKERVEERKRRKQDDGARGSTPATDESEGAAKEEKIEDLD